MNNGISNNNLDIFLKYKNENRLNNDSTIMECFKYFDKNK